MPETKPVVVMAVPEGYRLVTDSDYSDLVELRCVMSYLAGRDPEFIATYKAATKMLDEFDA